MRRLLLFPLILFPILSFAHEGKTGSRSLEFVRNEGQWKEDFAYKANNGDGDIFLENNGFTYVIGAADNMQRVHDLKHNKTKDPQVLKFHAYKVSFVDGHTQVLTGSKPQSHYYNYFLGKDPSRYKSGIHPMLAVDYKSVYSGVDVHIASQQGQMKYDFMVQPGADVSQIKLRFDGINGLSIKNKKLQISTSVGMVEEMAPYAYQYLNGALTEVACRYNVSDNEVSFAFPNGYDETALLVIDPTVVFSTYSGSSSDNWGFTATYDDAGNFYSGGIVSGFQGSSGYPTTIGAFQVTHAGGGFGGGNGNVMPSDMAITKFNPTGTAQIYSTYIGGSDNEQPHSMIVDAAGNLVIAGRSYSADFPVTQGCYDNTQNGIGDIVVVKLNPMGTGLVGSTFIGGADEDGANISAVYGNIFSLKHDYGDDARSEVIVDNGGNIYVAASTQSNDFPTVNATQSTLQGAQDGVIFKFDPNLTSLTWSTYLGGADDDAAYVLALDPTQTNLYAAGGTVSGLNVAFSGSLFPNFMGGSADGYIVRFQNSGSYTLQNGTYIGQGDYDQCFGIQIDDAGDVYAMGQTLGGSFPVTAGVFSNPGSSQFVIKLNSLLSTNIFSTVFGSGNSFAANISPVAFLVDNCQQIYISGWGGPLAGNGGNTSGMPVTPNAAQSITDGSDFYFIVLSQNAQTLLYGTYMGSGTLGEHVDGGTSRFNKDGVIYQAICGGCGGSSTFPTTPGVFGPTNGSSNCNLVSLKIAFELAGVTANAIANNDTVGCAPLTVQFQNLSSNATTFTWDFGDGSSLNSTNPNPNHTYTTPGTYIASLFVENLQSCANTSDTDYITIVVDSNVGANAAFTHIVTDSCGPYRVSLTNTSGTGTPTTTYHWNFGDGNTFTGANPGTHDYTNEGDYTITLITEDPNATCGTIDSFKAMVSMLGYVSAEFSVDDTGVCVGQSVVLGNGSDNSASVIFYLGNGDTLIGQSPVYQYDSAGVYTIMLVAFNPHSCNKSDTAYQTITVYPKPEADFTYSPLSNPLPNEPILFQNLSKGAIAYKWNFGDNEGSSEVNPSHLYKKSDKYMVCLQAENEFGCVDTLCKFVDAIIHPALDVPTGFSPNGDGNNDILYVYGAAVVTLDFKVYNRWGQMVFESTSMEKGWDGTYKGKPQEMEAYAWTVSATFIDGTSAAKSGNVTLMR